METKILRLGDLVEVLCFCAECRDRRIYKTLRVIEEIKEEDGEIKFRILDLFYTSNHLKLVKSKGEYEDIIPKKLIERLREK